MEALLVGGLVTLTAALAWETADWACTALANWMGDER